MLSVLVVGKQTGIPGDGFYRMAKAVDHLSVNLKDTEALLLREFRKVRDAHRPQ